MAKKRIVFLGDISNSVGPEKKNDDRYASPVEPAFDDRENWKGARCSEWRYMKTSLLKDRTGASIVIALA